MIARCARFGLTAENKRRSPGSQSLKSGMKPNSRTSSGSVVGTDVGCVAEEVSLGSSSRCGIEKPCGLYAPGFVLDQFDFRTFLNAEFSKRLASITDHLVQRERSSARFFDPDHLTESETVDP